MSRPIATPHRPACRRTLGALPAVCALAFLGIGAQARPHFPSTLVLEPLRIQSRPSTNPGYLPLVGSPSLRWADSPSTPVAVATKAPVVLYNPVAAPKTPATTAALTDSATSTEPATPPPLKPKDFLPYFQREGNPPPASGSPNEGLLFAPARPALPASSADFRQQ